jgi:hypothetical protein
MGDETDLKGLVRFLTIGVLTAMFAYQSENMSVQMQRPGLAIWKSASRWNFGIQPQMVDSGSTWIATRWKWAAESMRRRQIDRESELTGSRALRRSLGVGGGGTEKMKR